MKKWLVISALLALVTGFVLFLQRPVPLKIDLLTVGTGAVESMVANTRAGTIKSCQRSGLSMPMGGRVAEVFVKAGDKVKPGQPLLRLWNDDLTARTQQAKAALSVSKLEVQQTCFQAQQNARDAERQNSLAKRKLTADEAVEVSNTVARISALACESAKARILEAEAQVAYQQSLLDQTILKAPFAGVIAEINGELGEYVTPSPPGVATPPAVDLISDTCLYVQAPIDEVDAASIQLGQSARITLDAFKNHSFAGRVSRIAPYVQDYEKQARTVDIDVQFTELPKEVQLLVGYSADIEIVLEHKAQTLRIPTEALLEGARVLRYMPESQTLEYQPVHTGLSNWHFTEVTSGLSAGDRILGTMENPAAKAGVQVVTAPAEADRP
ncbi:MAG: efflux RND transporter periplasmic adaptor subunit [Hahellaceae bacterium]|nr:efflux RND transporter periplasmic adaptor subunit [Hahellaceae bacterium]MCP5170573.1 efflux RND transporter periplasmic adaptor subunit [Hahellaceae bacterium]